MNNSFEKDPNDEEECLGCETGTGVDVAHRVASGSFHPNCLTTEAEKQRSAAKGGKKKSKKATKKSKKATKKSKKATKKSKKRTTKKSKKRTNKKRK